MAKMILRIETCGNPDFGEDPTQAAPQCRDVGMPNPLNVVVNSYREAVEFFTALRDDTQIGGGNLVACDLYPRKGYQPGISERVARISYNGRAWRVPSNTEIKIK